MRDEPEDSILTRSNKSSTRPFGFLSLVDFYLNLVFPGVSTLLTSNIEIKWSIILCYLTIPLKIRVAMVPRRRMDYSYMHASMYIIHNSSTTANLRNNNTTSTAWKSSKIAKKRPLRNRNQKRTIHRQSKSECFWQIWANR